MFSISPRLCSTVFAMRRQQFRDPPLTSPGLKLRPRFGGRADANTYASGSSHMQRPCTTTNIRLSRELCLQSTANYEAQKMLPNTLLSCFCCASPTGSGAFFLFFSRPSTRSPLGLSRFAGFALSLPESLTAAWSEPAAAFCFLCARLSSTRASSTFLRYSCCSRLDCDNSTRSRAAWIAASWATNMRQTMN